MALYVCKYLLGFLTLLALPRTWLRGGIHQVCQAYLVYIGFPVDWVYRTIGVQGFDHGKECHICPDCLMLKFG